MYDCPIMGLNCILILPLDRHRCMYRHCLSVGSDVCFLISLVVRLGCMYVHCLLVGLICMILDIAHW